VIRLGRVQWQALHRLARAEGGLTTAALEDLAGRSVACKTMTVLGEHGLARVSGTVPNGRPDGKGKPRNLWVITRQGRQLLAEVRS